MSSNTIKAVAFVAVNPPEALRVVAVVLKHSALEHVVVTSVVGLAPVRLGHANQGAEAVDEALRVREFRTACLRPVLNKCRYLFSLPHGAT